MVCSSFPGIHCPGERLPSTEVIDLFAARDGSLWIATDGGLLQWQNGRSVRYLSGHSIGSILQDQNGGNLGFQLSIRRLQPPHLRN